MSVQGDDVQGYALGAVFGIVGLVVAGVIALAGAKAMQGPAASGAVPAQRIYFEAEGETLSAESGVLLARIAEAVRDNGQLTVLITGVRDARGDTAAAQRRALRVRHALEANGVPPAQLVLGQPHPAPRAFAAAKEASRVDITLQ
jgi:hypothetical protein